jgi:hypothetical protein
METQLDTLKEILSELFALLETQETNSTAVLQLLKDQGIASDEKLSTYLDQAGKASNVKWRAARMRMEYLLTPIRTETAGSDKSKQPEPKESHPPEAANKLEEEQRSNQAKDDANEKEQRQASTKSADKDIAEKSGDPKRDASNGAPKNNQRTSSKQTA